MPRPRLPRLQHLRTDRSSCQTTASRDSATHSAYNQHTYVICALLSWRPRPADMHVKILWSHPTTADSSALCLDNNVHQISCSLLLVAMQSVSISALQPSWVPRDHEDTDVLKVPSMEAVQVKSAYDAGVNVVIRWIWALRCQSQHTYWCTHSCFLRQHRDTLCIQRTWGLLVLRSGSGPTSTPSHEIHRAVHRLYALGAAFCAAAAFRNGVPSAYTIDSQPMRASGTASDTKYWEPASSFLKIARLDEYSVPKFWMGCKHSVPFAFHVC